MTVSDVEEASLHPRTLPAEATLAIEHSLDVGEPVDLVTLADTTGHSPEVMMKVYRAVNQRKSYDSHFKKIGDI